MFSVQLNKSAMHTNYYTAGLLYFPFKLNLHNFTVCLPSKSHILPQVWLNFSRAISWTEYYSIFESIFFFFFQLSWTFTFQEVLPGNEALVVFAKAWCSVRQKIRAFVLVYAKQDLSVFKVAWAEHGLWSVRQNLTIHNGDKRKPEEGWPWQDLVRKE